MKQNTTYKQTELGLIPDDWEVNRFTDIAELIHGFQFREEHFAENGRFGVIEIGNLTYQGNISLDYLSKTDCDKINNYERLFLKRGDILMALTGGTLGKMSIFNLEEHKYLQNYRVGKFEPNEKTIKNYIYYLLSSNYVQKRIEDNVNEAAQPNFGKQDFDKIKIPLPPLLEQKKIADCLSTWDSAIEKQSALINALTERKKALMQQLLTGKKRLPGFSDEWKEVKLGSICENFQNGNAFSAKDYKKTGIPIVTMGNINLGGYFYFSESKSNFWIEDKSLERYEIKKGDLIIAMTDVTPEKNLIGLTSIIDIDRIFYLNQRVGHIILKPKLADTDFIFYLSQNSYWRNQCKAFATLGVQANLGTNDIKNINIKLPSLSEQTAIAAILATADRELQLQKEKLAQLQIQKKGLMQVLLTGKKRLLN